MSFVSRILISSRKLKTRKKGRGHGRQRMEWMQKVASTTLETRTHRRGNKLATLIKILDRVSTRAGDILLFLAPRNRTGAIHHARVPFSPALLMNILNWLKITSRRSELGVGALIYKPVLNNRNGGNNERTKKGVATTLLTPTNSARACTKFETHSFGFALRAPTNDLFRRSCEIKKDFMHS